MRSAFCWTLYDSFIICRWVEDRVVADHLVEIWKHVVAIVNHWENLPKSKRPKSKGCEHLKSAVEDLLTPAKLQFFSFFASLFEPFLVMYQTDQPMIPYMYNDLQKLLRKLILLIVKPDLLLNCKSATDMKNLYFSDKSNLLKLKAINRGFTATSTLKELKREDLITNGQIASFFNNVMLFIRSTVQKFIEKSPIFYKIVCNSLVFDPQVVVN